MQPFSLHAHITHVCRHDIAGPLLYHINMPQAGFDPTEVHISHDLCEHCRTLTLDPSQLLCILTSERMLHQLSLVEVIFFIILTYFTFTNGKKKEKIHKAGHRGLVV